MSRIQQLLVVAVIDEIMDNGGKHSPMVQGLQDFTSTEVPNRRLREVSKFIKKGNLDDPI
jgi:hypothetical protein